MEQDFSGTPGRAGSSGRGDEIKAQTKQQGQQLSRRAREQAGALANRGGEQVKSQLANQKHQASQRLLPVQAALRETAQQLRKQGQDSVGQYAEKAADGVERTSSYLRETDVDEMTNEVRGFARSRPAVFLGGAAALGFLATRFFKSSAQGTTSSGGGPAVGGAPSQGTREPAQVHRGISEGPERPAAPAGGQPLEDRYAQVERAEPPRSY